MIGVDMRQFGQCNRASRVVPACLAAKSSSLLTPSWISISKRRFAGSGTRLAMVWVFSPITQEGASGTRQPHSGHSVSVQ